MTFGISLKLYSDCDPAYEGEVFRTLMSTLGIKKLRTTGYNPKANGLCEKSNAIVKKYLQKYVSSMEGDWDLWLNEATYAYNTSIHTSTGFSPAELMFGRKYRIPLDIMFGTDKNGVSNDNSVTQFKKNLEHMYEMANESMNTRQTKYLSYYNSEVYDDPLNRNELVYRYLPRKQREKLSLKWTGPCKILVTQHPVYKIEYHDEKGKCLGKWLTRDKLGRCEKGAIYPTITRPTYLTNNEIEDENKVTIFDDIVTPHGEQLRVAELAPNMEPYIPNVPNITDNNENANQARRYELRRNVRAPERLGLDIDHTLSCLTFDYIILLFSYF